MIARNDTFAFRACLVIHESVHRFYEPRQTIAKKEEIWLATGLDGIVVSILAMESSCISYSEQLYIHIL